MESSETLVGGKPLHEAILEVNDLGSVLAFHPLVMLGGVGMVRLNFNEKCRRYNQLKEELTAALVRPIRLAR